MESHPQSPEFRNNPETFTHALFLQFLDSDTVNLEEPISVNKRAISEEFYFHKTLPIWKVS